MAFGYDGSIKIDTSIDSAGFNKGVKGISGGLTSLIGVVGKLAAALAAAFAVKKIVDFTTSAAKLSAEFQRLEIAAQAVGQLYGYTAKETRSLVDQLVAAGIQTDIANRAAINFTREGLDRSLLPALARGAQDLAVFADSGESSSDVLDRLLYGVLTLNPLMLRTAGAAVDLELAYTKFAKAAGISTDQMSIQQKRQAALIALTEKLNGVTGLYELSQKTAAGQLSSNIRIMNEFRASIGTPFQDAFYRLIKGFNDLVKVMTAAIKPGGKLYSLMVNIGAYASILADIIVGLFRAIAGLFGVQLETAKSTADANKNIESTATNAAEAQGAIGDAIEKNKKKAQGALAAFDELNVLAQPQVDVGTGATTPVDVAIPEVIGEVNPAEFTNPLEAIQKRVEEIKENLKQKFLTFFEPLISAWIRFKEMSAPLIETVGRILKGYWEKILIPVWKWIIEKFIPAWLELGGAWLQLVNDALIALKPAWEWFYEHILKPAANWTGQAIIDALGWITEKLQGLHKWIGENQDAWRKIVTILAIVAGAVIAIASGPLAILFAIIVGLIYIIENWGMVWENIWDTAKIVFEAFIIIFKKAWDEVKTWFKSYVTDPLKDRFKTMLDSIRTAWERTFSGIKRFVKNIINGIIGLINSMISATIYGINSVIGALNGIRVNIPAILPWFGGASFGVSIPYAGTPRIPYLASGAVIPPNTEFAAILGDQRSGRNLEAPEGLIRQIIQEEIGDIRAEININFKGTMAALVRELKPVIDAENVRIGNRLVRGVP